MNPIDFVKRVELLKENDKYYLLFNNDKKELSTKWFGLDRPFPCRAVMSGLKEISNNERTIKVFEEIFVYNSPIFFFADRFSLDVKEYDQDKHKADILAIAELLDGLEKEYFIESVIKLVKWGNLEDYWVTLHLAFEKNIIPDLYNQINDERNNLTITKARFTFSKIDLEWREILKQYPNEILYAAFGFHPHVETTLTKMNSNVLKYFEAYKSNFQDRYLDIDYKAEIEFFKYGFDGIYINHENCIFKEYGLLDIKGSTKDKIYGIERDVSAASESGISWIEFYEQINKKQFNFDTYLETFDLIVYLVGRAKYAVHLDEIKSKTLIKEYNFNDLVKPVLNQSSEFKEPENSKLKVNQIALIHAYNGIPITRENAQAIAESFGYISKSSGEGLFQDFIFYGSAANRKGKPNPCTAKKLKNKIDLLESIIKHLTDNAIERAKDEIRILKTLYETDYQ